MKASSQLSAGFFGGILNISEAKNHPLAGYNDADFLFIML
jgi:hypothetical protein